MDRKHEPRRGGRGGAKRGGQGMTHLNAQAPVKSMKITTIEAPRPPRLGTALAAYLKRYRLDLADYAKTTGCPTAKGRIICIDCLLDGEEGGAPW